MSPVLQVVLFWGGIALAVIVINLLVKRADRKEQEQHHQHVHWAVEEAPQPLPFQPGLGCSSGSELGKALLPQNPLLPDVFQFPPRYKTLFPEGFDAHWQELIDKANIEQLRRARLEDTQPMPKVIEDGRLWINGVEITDHVTSIELSTKKRDVDFGLEIEGGDES